MAISSAGWGCSGAGPVPWQVDRFEEEVAVLVRGSGQSKTVPREQLPPQAQEGDVLQAGKVNRTATEALRKRVRTAREQAGAQAGSFDLENDGRGLTLAGQR